MKEESKCYIDVTFREDVNTYAAGWDTFSDRFDDGDEFCVDDGYIAWFTIYSDGKEVFSGNIKSGRYRFADGMIEKKTKNGWIKPKRFR